jgi:hypothetical protein
MVRTANLVILVLRVFLVGIQNIGNELELFVSAIRTSFPTFDNIHEVTHGFFGMVNMSNFRQLEINVLLPLLPCEALGPSQSNRFQIVAVGVVLQDTDHP